MGINRLHGHYEAAIIRSSGERETLAFSNLITDQGLNALLRAAMDDSPAAIQWYLGLKGVGDPRPSDTAQAHPGWTEAVGYDGAGRLPVRITVSGPAAQTSTVTYFITAPMTVHGAFLVSHPARGSGLGELFSVGNFASPRVLFPGDRFELSYRASVQRAYVNGEVYAQ